MSFSDLVYGSYGLLGAITGLFSAVIGLISFFMSDKVAPERVVDPSEEPLDRRPIIRIRVPPKAISVFFSLVGVLILVIIGAGRFIFSAPLPPPPSPAIEINPVPNDQVNVRINKDTGAGYFSIEGTSASVFSNPNLRIYLLVHPEDPPSPGWDIQQPATVGKDGRWRSGAWYGGQSLPPSPGNQIRVVAVAAPPMSFLGTKHIADIKESNPVAQSNMLTINIASQVH